MTIEQICQLSLNNHVLLWCNFLTGQLGVRFRFNQLSIVRDSSPPLSTSKLMYIRSVTATIVVNDWTFSLACYRTIYTAGLYQSTIPAYFSQKRSKRITCHLPIISKFFSVTRPPRARSTKIIVTRRYLNFFWWLC